MPDDGISVAEVGRRIGKRPGTVDRIDDRGMRPVERVILRLRGQGENYGEIANRLGRSGAQVRRIEGYTRLKN